MMDSFFDDLNAKIAAGFTYTPMTDEQYQISCVNDVQDWAEEIAGEWHPGLFRPDNQSQEDRAHLANDIIEKCAELKELIAEMENL